MAAWLGLHSVCANTGRLLGLLLLRELGPSCVDTAGRGDLRGVAVDVGGERERDLGRDLSGHLSCLERALYFVSSFLSPQLRP